MAQFVDESILGLEIPILERDAKVDIGLRE